jgi:hypothetical protein
VIDKVQHCIGVPGPYHYVETVTPIRITWASGALCREGVSYGISFDRQHIWVLPLCSGEFRIVVGRFR